MNRKPILFIAAFVFLALAASGVFLFLKNRQQQPQELLNEVIKLSDDQAVASINSFDGSAVWYFTSDAHLYRITADGSSKTEYQLPALSKIKSALWPKDGSDFIVTGESGGKQFKNYYSSKDKKYTALADNIQSFAWMPDGKRIVYVWKGAASDQLVLANADGTGFRVLANLTRRGLHVFPSPLSSEVLLVPSTMEGESSKIYSYSIQSGQFTTVIGEGRNTAALWLSDGYRFIFTQNMAGNSQPRVFLYDFNSRRITDLGVNASIDKIVLNQDNTKLYAAVPKRNASGDMFVEILLSDFSQSTYFDPVEDLRAHNLLLLQGKIYFTSTRDSKLYYINK